MKSPRGVGLFFLLGSILTPIDHSNFGHFEKLPPPRPNQKCVFVWCIKYNQFIATLIRYTRLGAPSVENGWRFCNNPMIFLNPVEHLPCILITYLTAVSRQLPIAVDYMSHLQTSFTILCIYATQFFSMKFNSTWRATWKNENCYSLINVKNQTF